MDQIDYLVHLTNLEKQLREWLQWVRDEKEEIEKEKVKGEMFG